MKKIIGNLQKLSPAIMAAAAGLFLFWVLESAICRRIGLDLFWPVQDGLLLPGRAARLGAALVICFALVLTQRGQRLFARARAALERERFCWLAAFVITGLFFLWTWRVTVFSFMTSDEVGILSSIRSVPAKGLQGAANTFSHVLFCGLIGSFYAIDADFWWYTAYHFLALGASLVIIGRCIFLKLRRCGHALLFGTLIHILLCGGLFMYTFAELSFTVTPGVVGTAAVALILCRGETKGRAGRICVDVGSVLLMLLCILQRRDTGKCLLCFWALAVVYQAVRVLLQRDETRRRQLLALAGLALIAPAMFFGAKSLGRSESVGYDSSRGTAEYYRSRVVDYLVYDMTDEDFEEAGIPVELGTLLRGWFFMDERINTDTFRTLVKVYNKNHSEQQQAESNGPRTLLSLPGDALSQIRQDPQMLWRALCAVSLLLLILALFARFGRACWPELLCALCAAGGAALLTLYLVYQGRFPTRVFLIVILPAIVTLLLMALSCASLPARAGGNRWFFTVPIALFAAAAAACCCVSVSFVPHIADTATADDVFFAERTVEAYANANPDILFITNMYNNNLDPFHDSHYPSNRDLWGDGGDTARTTGRLYADAFFRDDVQFMYEQASTIIPLLQYLTLDHGPVQALTVAQLTGTVYVSDISRVTPGDDYTGWYEQNGMTYYFIDGEAVTGAQIIDGEEYTFAPAGAGASIVPVASQAGRIFTTNAYSLVSDTD